MQWEHHMNLTMTEIVFLSQPSNVFLVKAKYIWQSKVLKYFNAFFRNMQAFYVISKNTEIYSTIKLFFFKVDLHLTK